MNLNELTIKKAHKLLVNKEITAVELAEAAFDRIKKREKDIHAFLAVTEKEARGQAEKVDEKILQGLPIPFLAGIPAAVKDNILIGGVQATAASKILDGYRAPYDATIINRLKEQGAVFVGKTNLDEFAMGSSTENSAYGATKNPINTDYVPGGSSGGSAVAVAAGECVYALGSDTGGSIRQPASFCGIVGFKPTYGAVSRHGLIAMASSLDQIGPLTQSVEDAMVVFEAIRGEDHFDSTSVNFDWRGENQNFDIEEIKIGVPREYFAQGIDPVVEQTVKKAIKKLESEGARVKEITLPHTQWALATYYIIMPAEVSANLARFDGIRYGYSEIRNPKSEIRNLLDVYLKSRQNGFGDEVRRRIMLGTYILSAGYYDAYYGRAQKVRRLIQEDFSNAFKDVDIIVTPTSPTTAFKFGEKTKDPLSMYLADIYTVSANLAGVPAVSVPAGPVRSSPPLGPSGAQSAGATSNGAGLVNDLPVGLQFIGKNFDDMRVLEIAKFWELIRDEKTH